MTDSPKPGKHILYVIIISQFCCTTLWFATNAILPQLQANHEWPATTLGYITSAVQIGFIVGTLVFAVLGLSDRYSPSLVFFISSIAAAVTNSIPVLDISSIYLTVFSRLATGFFLAGVYPVGMKIASDWQKDGLGHWLGALVGALVLGTAFPHALKFIPEFFNPELLILFVSVLSIAGGSGMYLLAKDGPFHKPSKHFSLADVRGVFRVSAFRAPAFGYFGHMWELYAFWAFIPITLMFYQSVTSTEFSLSLWTFCIIASGFAGCIVGGKLSLRYGSKKIAAFALFCSAVCCLLSPFLIQSSFPTFMTFMIFWGFTVVADSPQFSALIAFHAPPHVRGSALTITTCIGFAITIVSIQLLNTLQHLISPQYLLLLLAPGPLLGLIWLNNDKHLVWKK